VSDGTGEGPQYWFVGDGAAYDDAPDHWHREQLVPEPDALTDLECWELGCWLAGAVDGRPVVYDFDRKSGAPIDLPAIELDPAQPRVLIAGFSQRHPILAAQAADGPQVWYRDGGAWHEVPAPAGRIRSVRRAQRLVYLQLDGELWYTTLPKPGAPAATLAAHGLPAGLLRPG